MKTPKFLRGLAGLVLGVSAVLGMSGSAKADLPIKEHTSQKNIMGGISVDRNKVVYHTYNVSNSSIDVYGTNLDTEEEFLVSKSLDVFGDSALKDDVAYLSGNGAIKGTDLKTGLVFPIITTSSNFPFTENRQYVSEDCLIWNNSPDTGTWAFDFRTRMNYKITDDKRIRSNPSIGGDLVVYQEINPDVPQNSNMEIWAQDIYSGKRTPIHTGPGVDVECPVTNGDFVVWREKNPIREDLDLMGYQISTGEYFPVCTAEGDQMNALMDKNTCVWWDGRNLAKGFGGDIYGFDLKTKQEFPISTNGFDSWNLALSNGKVAWLPETQGIESKFYTTDIPECK